MAQSSRFVILAALGANLLIAATKFSAAAYTGSAAMFSEAVHSAVDTANQVLLLFGLSRAARPADAGHPFGHGLQLYFWSFVVAMLIFGVGAGVSLIEGIGKIRAPHPVESAWVNYAVLGAAVVFEGVSWCMAVREFRHQTRGQGWLRALRDSKDPALFTVLLEDTAALIGLAVALAGVGLSQVLAMPVLDGAASVVIAVVLSGTAGFLAWQCQSLLSGEGASAAVQEGIRAVAIAAPAVARVNDLLTMHFGPRDVLVALSLDFHDDRSAGEVEQAVTEIERAVKTAHPEVTRVFVEAQGWAAHRGA